MTRVLVAEDNEDIQNLLRIYLKRSGAEVNIASNGQELVDMAFTDQYDLVFLDIEMPVLNGIETAKTLRKNGFYQPLYAFTSNDDQQEIAQYLANGFVGHLKKPLDPKQLREILNQYQPDGEMILHPSIMDEENLLRKDPDIAPLIDQFLDRLPSTINKMEYALNRLDWESLTCFAHQLKGAAGGFGYPYLTDIAAELEKSLKHGEVYRSQGLFDKLKCYVFGKPFTH